jgi:hypothetical protein
MDERKKKKRSKQIVVDANRHLRGSGEKLDIIPSNQVSSEDNEGEFFE